MHANKYYKMEHSFFKSAHDARQLEFLWNQYWVQTISSSPLLNVSRPRPALPLQRCPFVCFFRVLRTGRT